MSAKWTAEENVIIVGSIPEYRYHIAQGLTKDQASNQLAQKILQNDASFNFLVKRNSPQVQNAQETIAQHIRRMDDITKGITPPNRPPIQHELPWLNLLP